MTCARAAFRTKRPRWRGAGERMVYRLPKSRTDGTQHI